MRRKATTFLTLLTVLLVSSCSRDNDKPLEKALPGKWELSGVYNTGITATTPQWHPYKNGSVITIHPDSSYTSSGQHTKELTPYSYEGKFYGYSASDSSISHRYMLGDRRVKVWLEDNDQTLIVMGVCSKGCGERFNRIP